MLSLKGFAAFLFYYYQVDPFDRCLELTLFFNFSNIVLLFWSSTISVESPSPTDFKNIIYFLPNVFEAFISALTNARSPILAKFADAALWDLLAWGALTVITV